MMDSVRLIPSVLSGTAVPPPSKSEAHRMLLMAALGEVPCLIGGLLPPLCGDVLDTLSVVAALGAGWEQTSAGIRVTPGAGEPQTECAVKESAATLRMSLPVFARLGREMTFRVSPVLFHRVKTSLAAFSEEISTVSVLDREGAEECSITVSGALPAGDYEMTAGETGQLVSGMLLALTLWVEEEKALSTLTVKGPLVSRPYVDMTAALLERYGRALRPFSASSWLVCAAPPPPVRKMIPAPDASAAAVWLAMGVVGKAPLAVKTHLPSLQGDGRLVELLSRMGASLMPEEERVTVAPSRLRSLEADCTDTPDLLPLLALLCTQAEGESRLKGVSRLLSKECDRAAATEEILRGMGAEIERVSPDEWRIPGPSPLQGAVLDAREDHRMAMLIAAAACAASSPVTLTHSPGCTAKSDPAFWETYTALGGIMQCPSV